VTLELYHHGSSVCAAKTRLALAEKGVEWTGRYLDILAGEHQTPEYLALNPKAVVPTLVHDGHVIRESTVICEYIDDAFDGPPLKPTAPLALAEMRLWTKRVDEDVHPSVRPITYVTTHRHTILAQGADEVEAHIAFDPDPAWRARKRAWIYDGFEAPDIRLAVAVFDKLFADMDKRLSDHEWLAGDAYSLADTGLTPYANRMAMLGFDALFEGRPHLVRWFDAVRARPSFAPGIEQYLPDDLRRTMKENGRKARPDFERLLAAQ